MIRNTFLVEIWPLSHMNDAEPQESGLNRVKKSKNFPGRTPDPLEACAFGTHFGDWSVFILDPCLLARHTIMENYPTSRNMLQ